MSSIKYGYITRHIDTLSDNNSDCSIVCDNFSGDTHTVGEMMKPTFCVLHSNGQEVLININNINSVTSSGGLTSINFSNGNMFVDETIEAILKSFAGDVFVQCKIIKVAI